MWTSEHILRIQHEAIRVLGRSPSVDGMHTLKKLSRRLEGAKELRAAARAELQNIEQTPKSGRTEPDGDAS